MRVMTPSKVWDGGSDGCDRIVTGCGQLGYGRGGQVQLSPPGCPGAHQSLRPGSPSGEPIPPAGRSSPSHTYNTAQPAAKHPRTSAARLAGVVSRAPARGTPSWSVPVHSYRPTASFINASLSRFGQCGGRSPPHLDQTCHACGSSGCQYWSGMGVGPAPQPSPSKPWQYHQPSRKTMSPCIMHPGWPPCPVSG
jgi:hypothetical protein